MRAIFISYRRDDSEGQAGRLYDDLSRHFGDDAVFMDVAAIEPGRDFRRVIDDHVASCGVLLAIIGKSWLSGKNEAGARRLDDPMDFVRLETASALKRDIPVVPVLVHGAKMPQAEDLPEDLQALAFRNAVELTHARWDSDVQVLVKALQAYVQPQERPAVPPVPLVPPPGSGSGKMAGTIGAIALVGVALAAGGYLWHQQSAEAEAARAAAEAQAQQVEAASKDREAQALAEAAGAARAQAVAEMEAKQAEETARKDKEMQAAEARQQAETARKDREDREAQAVEAAASRARAAAETEARQRQEADRVSALQAKEQALAAERATMERTRTERPDPRARWKIGNFPPPNAGYLLYTITSRGDPACVSYDGASCLWGTTINQIDFSKLKPLVCGNPHKARWGVTGYEDPKHWCSLARGG
ncbi:MAG: TIR domain-containing protein [Azonexus sp.]|jgi:flagellar biosynthesis GTPase FlhF|nr:TIR domain-containing protein [Azonexus sp.]MBP9228114.1 TIR domain-containing protein [Azonexus sp.]